MKIKILTYNIHKGFDWNKKNYFLQDIKKLVKDSHANIVLLQEVVGQNVDYKKRGLIESQYEYIADSIWSNYSYAKNSIYKYGHHGNMVLSEFPIESWENINISTNIFEQRGLLYCKIALSDKLFIYVICVHLNLSNIGRQKQYIKIKDYLKKLEISKESPIVIAGDFNDWNLKATQIFENDLNMVEAYKNIKGDCAKTFPAGFPVLKLDRIYVKNINIISASVLDKVDKYHFSDHLPLICEVETNEISLL